MNENFNFHCYKMSKNDDLKARENINILVIFQYLMSNKIRDINRMIFLKEENLFLVDNLW